MKKIFYLLLIASCLFSCNQKKLHEEILTKHENGNKKETKYYNINKDGSKTYVKETWYYEEGMKHLDGPLVDNKRQGNFITYYKSGALMSTGEFVNGVREGKATIYHENGNVHYEGYYKNGKECGIWKFYNEEGKLTKEVNRDLR